MQEKSNLELFEEEIDRVSLLYQNAEKLILIRGAVADAGTVDMSVRDALPL